MIFLTVVTAQAIPYFARKYNQRCSSCHLLPPALSETGMNFAANGYRLPEFAATRYTRLTERVDANQETAQIEAGLSDRSVPLDKLAQVIQESA